MEDFYIENKIYYHDTDAGGVVYYANYLKHLEESRCEFLLSKGVDLVDWAKQGVLFPVVHLEADYKNPAKYGDKVRVYTRFEKLGNASLEFSQEIKCSDVLLMKAKTVWACVDKNIKPIRIPEEIRSRLKN